MQFKLTFFQRRIHLGRINAGESEQMAKLWRDGGRGGNGPLPVVEGEENRPQFAFADI